VIRTRLARLTVLAAVAALAGAGAAALIVSPAVAHEIEVVRSTPAAGSVLERSPQRVVIMFSGEPDAARSSIVVVDARGRRVKAVSPARAVPGDTLRLQAVVRDPLSDGPYTVKWRAVTLDGHATTGSFSFRVDLVPETGPSVRPPSEAPSAAAAADAPASTSPAAADTGTGRSALIVAVNVALLIGVVAAVTVFLRRRSRRAPR
jgi:methionine-rich copper-binding protein CopC